jgi:hypothetical protein
MAFRGLAGRGISVRKIFGHTSSIIHNSLLRVARSCRLSAGGRFSLRVHERAGNHEEFQLKVDYIGIGKKARIFSPLLLPSEKVSGYLGEFSRAPGGFRQSFLGVLR